MLKAFREFAMRGNALDMAVGVILGASFGGIVKSLVDDIIMPPVGLLLGGVDFSDIFVTLRAGNLPGPYPTLAAAKQAGAVTLNTGVFINTVISFIIIALAVFLLVRGINTLRTRMEGPPAAKHKDCPHCFGKVDVRARRCPHCTSPLHEDA